MLRAWLIFKQDSPKKPHQMVGSVRASDAEMALLQARTVHTRRPKAISLWVVPRDRVGMWTHEEITTSQRSEQATSQDDSVVTWQVFWKTGQRRSMTFVDHVGQVQAVSAETALQLARDTFTSKKQAWVWMLVPDSEITRSTPDDVESWFEPAISKTYKQQSAYGFIGETRQSRSRGKQQEPTE